MSSTSDSGDHAASQPAGERTGLAALVFNARARSLFFQAALAIAILAMIAVAINNAAENLAAQGRAFGFDFFDGL